MAKKFYIPGMDKLNQMVETPASKEKTDFKRYIVNTIISIVSAVVAIVAAVVAIMTYLR